MSPDCYFILVFVFSQEFVQSEMDREAAAIANDRERARKAEDRSAGVDDRLKSLREQVSTLQEGVSQVWGCGGVLRAVPAGSLGH